MTKFRILLVDDQHEVRRMLKTGIESLGKDYQVLDMPSAEEAMLVLGIQPVDLLISDVRLPGMTGLELKERVQRRNPHLKVILITGLTDLKTRKQVAEAGAHAFFIKPLVLADFLDAVERTLGVVETILPPEPILIEEPAREPSLAERLAALRSDLKAEAVLLLDDQGKIVAEAGSLPELEVDSPLLNALMSVFSLGSKVAQALGRNAPEDLCFFRGEHFDLALTHVGLTFALVVSAQPAANLFSAANQAIAPAVGDLVKMLERMGAPAVPQEIALAEGTVPQAVGQPGADGALPPTVNPQDMEEPVEISETEMMEFEALFGKVTDNPLAGNDVDSFWDAATQDADPNDIGNTSAISYDQARQLGLAPDENEG